MPENQDSGKEKSNQNPDQLAELEAKIKELGYQKDQIEVLQKAIDAGALIYKPSKVEDLPDELKSDIQNLIKSKAGEETQKAKDQLYASMESQKEKIQKLTEYVEEQKRLKAEEEQKRQEAEEAARREKMTLEERLQEFEKQKQDELQKIRENYEQQFQTLNQDLHKTKLTAAKEKLLAQYGDQVILEMVPDVESASNMSLEELQQRVELAHETFKKYYREPENEEADAVQTPPNSPSSIAKAREQFGNGKGRDSHLTGKKAPFDLDHLKKNGTKEELDAAADIAVRQFMASQGKL